LSQELLARFLLNQHLKPGVTCSSADRKRPRISTGKLLALVFLEKRLDRQSGKLPISRNELLAPLPVGIATLELPDPGLPALGTTVALVKEKASLSGPKAEPFSGWSDEPGLWQPFPPNERW